MPERALRGIERGLREVRERFLDRLDERLDRIRLAMARAVCGGRGRSTGLIWTRKVSVDRHSRISGVSVGLPLNPPSQ